MSRRFFKPFFSFWENMHTGPYISKKSIPGGSVANKQYYKTEPKNEDPQETFDKFFSYENLQKLKKEEREFFENHFPQKIGKKFNPYQVLGVQLSSDLEKIKQAYRTNAIKYHPKNDSSPVAQKKFRDLARAYNAILQQRKMQYYGEDHSNKSLFEDFQKRIESIDLFESVENKNANVVKENNAQVGNKNIYEEKNLNQNQKQVEQKSQKKDLKVKNEQDQKQQRRTKSYLAGAQLYSEASYFELLNNKRKLHLSRIYQKNGKIFKVDRIELDNNDGTIEVNQTLSDGNQVRQRKFTEVVSRNKQGNQ